MVEHLEHHELIAHLKECHRILKHGGVVRIGVPNFSMIINNYQNEIFFEKYRYVVPGQKFGLPDSLICYADLLNRAFYEFGQHKIVLDVEKMKNLLIFAGFKETSISEESFDETCDLEIRREATFYMQAVK
jgi:predicted SAM-dependent methyltransferase